MQIGEEARSHVLELESADGRDRVVQLYRYAQVGRCVNSVTHDLNNYLGAIMAYAELVSMEPGVTDEARRMLGEIVNGVRRSSDLVNDLTGVARRERMSIGLANMHILCNRVANLRRYDFQVSRVELNCHIDSSAGDLVIDQPKIECALIYLLSNALEEAINREGDRSVTLEARGDAERIEVSVRNHGAPIQPEIADSMFDPFFSTKSGAHLGLGLTLARDIATLHDGTLYYTPERGFLFSLPKKSALAEQITRED